MTYKEIAEKLCEGYLDMPCSCDGCPLCDTMDYDDDGNVVCVLYRKDADKYRCHDLMKNPEDFTEVYICGVTELPNTMNRALKE